MRPNTLIPRLPRPSAFQPLPPHPDSSSPVQTRVANRTRLRRISRKHYANPLSPRYPGSRPRISKGMRDAAARGTPRPAASAPHGRVPFPQLLQARRGNFFMSARMHGWQGLRKSPYWRAWASGREGILLMLRCYCDSELQRCADARMPRPAGRLPCFD